MLNHLIVLFLFLLPFQLALNPSPDMDVPVGRIFAIIILAWWLVEVLATRTLRLPGALITGIIISFMGWISLSLWWADNLDFALRKYLFLMNFLPLLFVFYDRADEGSVDRWIRAFLWGALLSALVALLIFLSQFFLPVGMMHSWLTTTLLPIFLGNNLGAMVREYSSLLVNIGGETLLRATGLFPDPHVAAYYFGLAGILALGMFQKERKLVFLVVAGMLLMTDLLTFSRGGYLGLLLGLALFGGLNWSSFPRHWQTHILTLVVLGIGLLALFGQPILSRFTSTFSLGDTSNLERVVLWQEALGNIGEAPLLGTGLGNYILTVRPTAGYREPYYAHNLYLDLGAELGLIGLTLFLLLIGAGIAYTMQGAKKRQKGSLSVVFFSLFLLYLTHSLFETALYSVHILPLLVFFLSLAWYDGDTYEERT